MKILPLFGSKNLSIKLIIVDFPDPDNPTIAIFFPAGIMMFISCKTSS